MTDRLAELGALQYVVENLSTAGTNPNRLGLAGYIHAAYTDYQVWAAANPGVNPNRLSARGRLYGYFYDYGFSPLNLFSAGEVGVFYDPSDLSTMFQDSAGTTQVTADGQPVGLILDKSKGLVLGPELVTNGDFSAGSTGWTTGTGWSITGGAAVSAGSNQFQSISQNCSTVAGKTYKITFDVSRTGGSILLRVGGGTNFADISSSGSKSFYIKAEGAGISFLSNASGYEFVGSVDNISVRELPGNHASQATAASRPLYKTDGTHHWLQFDGVDDSLSTAAIDFTSTDKMSVFGGIRNVGVTTDQLIVETSVNSFSNPGTFQITTSTSGRYVTASAGTVFSFTQGNAHASATTDVVTITADIAGDSLKLREDGTQTASSVTDQGTGTYLTYPLYIGARGGASLRLNGNIYSLIVRGALSTTQEITDTETWVNSKTGAY